MKPKKGSYDHWEPGLIQIRESQLEDKTAMRCSTSFADFPAEHGHRYGGDLICMAEECKEVPHRGKEHCHKHERQFYRTGTPHSQRDAANLGLMEYYDRLRASEEPEE